MPAAPDSVPGDVPDCTLLPTQRRHSTESPARALAVAVLALAVNDLLGRGPVSYTGARKAVPAWRARMATAAAEWIAADEPGVPFSFASLCAVLGLDPDGVRRALAGRQAA
jgi:hypothetical protein